MRTSKRERESKTERERENSEVNSRVGCSRTTKRNKTGQLAPSYKAGATAGPIHTRLLCGNKAPGIEARIPLFVLFYSSMLAEITSPRVQWQLGIPFFAASERDLFADVFEHDGAVRDFDLTDSFDLLIWET